VSRSRSRKRASCAHQARRIRERIRRARGADPRQAAESRAQDEFAREQMRLEAESDLHLPTDLGEPEPLL
jgi:hypothetical protein